MKSDAKVLTNEPTIDRVTLRVLGGAFNAIAKEMAQTL